MRRDQATGRFVFVSGIDRRRPDGSIAGIGDITEQTRQVCENVKSAVGSGGARWMISAVDVYVRNMETSTRSTKCVRNTSSRRARFDHGGSHQDDLRPTI